MNIVWWPNIILAVGWLGLAYFQWQQYQKLRKIETLPESFISRARTMAVVWVMLALANVILPLWFHP